jgi:hypothetical protein
MKTTRRARGPSATSDILSRANAEAAGLLKEVAAVVSGDDKHSNVDAFRLAACSARQLFERIASDRGFAEQYLDTLRRGSHRKTDDLIGQYLFFGCRTQPIICDPNGRNCLGSVTCCIIFGFRFCIVIIRPSASDIVAGRSKANAADRVETLRVAACQFSLLFEKVALDPAFARKLLRVIGKGSSKEAAALLRSITFGPCRIIGEEDRVTICCTIRGTEYCLIIFTGPTD